MYVSVWANSLMVAKGSFIISDRNPWCIDQLSHKLLYSHHTPPVYRKMKIKMNSIFSALSRWRDNTSCSRRHIWSLYSKSTRRTYARLNLCTHLSPGCMVMCLAERLKWKFYPTEENLSFYTLPQKHSVWLPAETDACVAPVTCLERNKTRWPWRGLKGQEWTPDWGCCQ